MKILIVSELFYPKLRGGEVVLWRIAQALARRGHDVVVVTSRSSDTAAHETVNGVEIHRPHLLATQGMSNSLAMAVGKLRFMRKLYRYLDQWVAVSGVDLIYNNAYTVTLPCGRLGRRHGIPVVTNIGNLQGTGHRESTGWWPIGWVQQWKEWIILRYGGHRAIRVASEAVARHIRPMTRAGVHVIPSPIDAEAARAARESVDRQVIRAETDLDDDELLLLFVGALEPVKNVDAIIDVVSRIKRSVKLLVVGTGREEPRLRAQVERLGIAERITFLGAQPHDRVLELMAAADALLLASKSENLPTVVLEALSVGTPVVSTDVGGVREISSRNLTVVNSVEGIREVIEQGTPRYGDWSVLENYSTDAIAEQFERMFETVVARASESVHKREGQAK
ncbi:MAG: glycosyltransferase family 4 protein [Salinibacter sp.]